MRRNTNVNVFVDIFASSVGKLEQFYLAENNANGPTALGGVETPPR